jgi:hypothetical protein
MYLIACHSDASAYSLTNSPKQLHGGLWYFQLPQLFALANSMNVLDRIVVVGYDKSFEDDVIIALNGHEVMSLASFHEINFECETILKVVRVMLDTRTLMLHMDMPSRDSRVKQTKMVFIHLRS